MMVAYAAANHRAENATSAPTIRDADASMRPIEAGQPAQYRPVVSGGTWPTIAGAECRLSGRLMRGL